MTGNTTVVNINLHNNNLVGTIQASLGNLSNLQSIVLYSNQLMGSIPPELSNLSQLIFLELNANQLTGSIPAELGNLSKLRYTLSLLQPAHGEHSGGTRQSEQPDKSFFIFQPTNG